ncbi:glycosyltransferase family 61 protein [uncultured Helicobacter sp.]|uniref:glycosyltransferase family 61 protein n=1 Tax=uncultured Helicobacter sp. TaxID=175537 RepID=UPI00374F1AFE
MLQFLCKALQSRTTTFEQAKAEGEIIQDIEVYPSKNILVCGNGIYTYKDTSELDELVNTLGGGDLHAIDNSKSSPKQYSNFHFRDIFGRYHRFFRPYTRTLAPLKVRVFADAYCYSDSSEILITKSKKALISQTSYITHEFAMPRGLTTLRRALFVLKQIYKWLKFFIAKTHNIHGTVAVMHQARHYGHYLVESVSSMLQILESNVEIDYYILDISTPFAKAMVELLQIPTDKILSPTPHRLMHADRIVLPTLTADVEIVEYRDRILWGHTLSLPLNILDFYTRLACDATSSHSSRKIFLKRPENSNRNFENPQEVEEIFAEYGYEIILPDTLSLLEQITLMQEAKVIASMHGAGLVNVLFAPSDAVVFEIFSQYYHDFGLQMCVLLKHQKYLYMVGETHDISVHPQKESVYIEPQKLRQALRIVEQHV